jgi:hypothetical protein
MDKESSDAILNIVDGLTRHIVQVQARCDALTSMVQIMAMAQGKDRMKVQVALDTLTATSFQKRLEKIEDQSPLWAARLDTRPDASAVDPVRLDNLQ